MDCTHVRRQILQGKENRPAVRRHLSRCADCRAFQQNLQRTEALMENALPFALPPNLEQRLQSLVPEAAQSLQTEALERTPLLSRRESRFRQILQALLLLSIPLALLVGFSFWRQGWAVLEPYWDQIWGVLPLIPDALVYWGGRLGDLLNPARDALLFILSFLLLGLALEHLLKSGRSRTSFMLPR